MKAPAESRQGLQDVGGSITDGWRRLRESAAGAMTRFKLGGNFSPPAPVKVG
jgi:hypothetical protein